MLDKLHLSAQLLDDTSDEITKKLWPLLIPCGISRTRYHGRVVLYQKRAEAGQVMAIHTEPWQRSISPLKIETNPAHFESFDELSAVLDRVAHHSCFSITRLDHAVDIPVPISEVYASLHFPRKAASDRYRGPKLEGFMYGVRPELLAVYDRARKTKTEGPLTRVELRQFREKVSATRLSQLSCLREAMPFKDVLFMRLRECSPESRHHYKTVKLFESIREHGFQRAAKVLGEHHNFRRDFASVLMPQENIPDLNMIYRANLNKFFGVQTEPKTTTHIVEDCYR